MNLAMAQYLFRAKEIGVRKVVGASRRQLIWQYLSESVLLALISFVLALVVAELMRPLFYYLTEGDKIPLSRSTWSSDLVVIKLLCVAIIVGIFAGTYPAFFLSGFRPNQILRGCFFTGKKGTRIRHVLVVLQFFALCVGLFIYDRSRYVHFYRCLNHPGGTCGRAVSNSQGCQSQSDILSLLMIMGCSDSENISAFKIDLIRWLKNRAVAFMIYTDMVE